MLKDVLGDLDCVSPEVSKRSSEVKDNVDHCLEIIHKAAHGTLLAWISIAILYTPSQRPQA